VFLSPEGKRVTTGDIGKFNKGSFHLATSLGAPIVPMYFAVPRAIDPGMGYDAKPGVLDVYFLPPIDTSDWTVDEVEQHRDDVRALYVRVHHAVRETGALPASLLLEDAPLMEEALA
jgi:1-acyl-sn-glycerol-3-phosphate acyltransferase